MRFQSIPSRTPEAFLHLVEILLKINLSNCNSKIITSSIILSKNKSQLFVICKVIQYFSHLIATT